MSKTDHIEDTNRAIEELVEAAEEIGWDVTSIETEIDTYDTPQAALYVELPGDGYDTQLVEQSTSQDDVQSVKEIVGELEQKRGSAEIARVEYLATTRLDMDAETASEKITDLKKRGEVYEPSAGVLRTI